MTKVDVNQIINKLAGKELTKKEADYLIKWAMGEIKEWNNFISMVKARVKE